MCSRPLAGRMAALTLCTIGTLSLVCRIACAQTQLGAAATEFDLPSQPLGQALEQYDERTNLSVFFPSELAIGRVSHPVHGTFSNEQALRLLLQGTGLTMQAVAAQAFVLVPTVPDPGAAAKPTAEAAGLSSQRAYDGLLQARVLQMLCTRPDFSLGQYRLALSVRVNATGRIDQARLLDTTGNARRDSAIVEALQRVEVGQAPVNRERPFVLLVQRRTDSDSPACPVLH